MKLLRFSPRQQSCNMDAIEAKRLTGLFLAGSTDHDEEKRLYSYYAGKHVDPSLECYRSMFLWYASIEGDQAKRKRPSKRNRILAIAASLTIVALVGAGLLMPNAKSDQTYSIESAYAGSYIIRDGKKITDIDAILPELQRAERFADSTLLAVNQMSSIDNIEMAMFESILNNIPDPEIREMLLSDIAY